MRSVALARGVVQDGPLLGGERPPRPPRPRLVNSSRRIVDVIAGSVIRDAGEFVEGSGGNSWLWRLDCPPLLPALNFDDGRRCGEQRG